MQASWRRLINQSIIGQLWPPRPQSVVHILLLLGPLTRIKWRVGEKGEEGNWGENKALDKEKCREVKGNTEKRE